MARIPIRQYNIMDNIGAVGDERMAGGYDDFQDFGVGPVQSPSPTFPTMGAISRIGAEPPVNTMDPRTMGQEPNIAQLMQQFYTPETEATDAFNQLVRNAPTRNKPGIARRLAASGAALKGGPQVAEQFMYAPYMRDTADWMAKMDPNYKAASLENTRNANERQLAGSMAQYTMSERKQTESERKNRADEKIRADRAAVYRFKTENPNLKIVTPKGGNITAIDPLTGKSIPILDAQGKPISTGSLSDEDAINLRGEWSVEAAGARGRAAQDVETTRQTGRENLQWDIFQQDGKTYRINRVTGVVEPVKIPEGTIVKPGTPPRPSGAGGGNEALNVQRQRFNTARQIADTVPGANKWIKFTSPTTFRVEQPGRFTSEAERKLYQDITNKIYGGEAGKYTGSGTPGGGRGGGAGRGNQPQQATIAKKEYSPSRNQTRITYSDGRVEIVNGRQ